MANEQIDHVNVLKFEELEIRKGEFAIWLINSYLKLITIFIAIIAILINAIYYYNTDHVLFNYIYNFVIFIYQSISWQLDLDKHETITMFVLSCDLAATVLIVLIYCLINAFSKERIQNMD